MKNSYDLTDEKWAIIDYKAVTHHARGMGKDPDCLYGSATGREVASANHIVRCFLDAYLMPILDGGFQPRQIIVAHDAGHEYRTSLFSGYKEKRDKRKNDEDTYDVEIHEEMEKADKVIQPLLAYLGCTQIKVDGVEGDDIIGWLVKGLPGKKSVYTVDADLLVLCDEDTLLNMKNNPIFVNSVELEDLPKNMRKFYEPMQDFEGNPFTYLTLYKSLVGDSSDEYKGVSGFGDTRWTQLVEAFDYDGLDELIDIVDNRNWKELDNVLSQLDEGSSEWKLIKMLDDNQQDWKISWEVAKIHPELCWKPRRKKLTKPIWYKRVPDANHVKTLLTQSFCAEFIEDLEDYLPVEWLLDADSFEGESDIEEFKQLCEESPFISYDYEGFAEDYEDLREAGGAFFVDVRGQKITGASINFGANLQYTFYLTVDHFKSANLPMSVLQDFLLAIPEDKVKVAHNSVFEEAVTLTNMNGFHFDAGSVHDTNIMSMYVDENRESSGLKAISQLCLNYKQTSYQATLEAPALPKIKAELGCEDASVKSFKDVQQWCRDNDIKAERFQTVKAKHEITKMNQLTADQVVAYGIDDSKVTAHLYDLHRMQMCLENTWQFYIENEPYVNHRFAKSFVEGVDLDVEALAKIRAEDEEEIAENDKRMRELLLEHCSKPNPEYAKAYFEEEKKWLMESYRAQLHKLKPEKLFEKADGIANEIEKMEVVTQTFMEIAEHIRKKVPAARTKAEREARDLSGVDPKTLIAWCLRYQGAIEYQKILEGSVYVPFTSTYVVPSFAPSAKNLDAVAAKLDLPEPGTAAKGKLGAWEADIREIDFATGQDKYNDLNEEQKKFIDLLREAIPYFAPDKRDNENFEAFAQFCAQTLQLEGKTVYSGSELNTGSSVQMKHLLYAMLGLPVRLRGTASESRKNLGFWEGSPSTDKLAIDTALSEDISVNPEWEWKGEVLNCMKRISECTQRISLYHNSYPKFVHPLSGKMHPSLRNYGTVTGRPTGSKPNILQVSKHQKKGVMRSVYIPPRGYAVVPIDFAGQELRIQASETRDPNLLSVYLGSELTEQYLSGEVTDITYAMVKDKKDLKDLHGLTASSITKHFGLDESGDLIAGGQPEFKWVPETYEEYMEAYKTEDDSDEHSLASKVRKRPAKQTNFLLSYGGTEQTLSHRLIIPEVVAKGIMDSTLTLYSGITEAQDATLKFAKTHGYVETAYGVRRHITEDVFSKSRGPVNRIQRQAYNFRIQGCAANILKVVLAECEKTEIWDRMQAIMLAPVYDEVVAFVPYEHVWDFIQEMRSIMNLTPPNQAVPMVADISFGPNWQIQHEFGDQPTKGEILKCLEEEVIPVVEETWDRIEGISA